MPRATTIAFLTALTAPALGACVLGVWANPVQAEDRYGPPHPTEASAQAQAAAAPASGWLNWSTKTPARDGAEAMSADQPSRFQPALASARPDHMAAVLPTSLYSAYPSPAPRQAAASWTPPSRAAAAPAPASAAGSAATNQAPRFYSVHREFGLRPDPIPLPQQFFADSGGSDLAAPPPPLAPHPVAGTQAATSPLNTASNRAREVELETADSAAN
jgi:hypothetical protein